MSAALYSLLTAIVVIGILVLRGVQPFTMPQAYSDEPVGFIAPARADGAAFGILDPWNGFVHVLPRFVHLAAAPFPAAVAPVIATLSLYVVIALVGAFVASHRMATAIPSRSARLAAALALAVLPASRIPLASVLNAQFYLGIYVAALALASGRHWTDRPAALVAALTGPAGIFLAPVFWLRGRRDLAAIVSAGGVFQVLTYSLSARRPGLSDIEGLPWVLLLRVGSTVTGDVIGRTLTQPLLVAVGVAVAITIALGVRDLPRSTVVVLGYVALATAGAGLMSGTGFEAVTQGTRYFIPLAFLVMLIAAAGAVHRRVVAVPLVAVLAIGIASDFRLPVYPDVGWPSAAACIDSAGPCRVNVWPEHYAFTWSDAFEPPTGAAEVIGRECCVGPAALPTGPTDGE